MRLERFLATCAFAVLACAPALAIGALATTFEADYDDETKEWKEIEAQLPAYPDMKNLLEVRYNAETPHRFFVDASSVTLGLDGVTRYTSVLRTAGGALNVSYEAIRCETRESKIYAFARKDGTWMRARKPEWKRVLLRDLTPHRYVLYRQFFCPSPAIPTPPKTALDALRRGEGLAPGTGLDQ
jgi:hypothetical protein